jgi:hypothetical protein
MVIFGLLNMFYWASILGGVIVVIKIVIGAVNLGSKTKFAHKNKHPEIDAKGRIYTYGYIKSDEI